MCECAPGIVRRINIDAFDRASELLRQRLESQEVVAKDEAIVAEVLGGDKAWSAVGAGRIFVENGNLGVGKANLVIASIVGNERQFFNFCRTSALFLALLAPTGKFKHKEERKPEHPFLRSTNIIFL